MGSITHAFTDAHADGPDATLVRPSNWNDPHNYSLSAADVGAPSGSGTSTGANTGDQTITLTGAVTGSGTGSFATTLAASPALTTPIIGAYTFATLPAASSNSGATARVTDVGAATAGSLWISNGTIWKPVNGGVCVLASCAPLTQAGGLGEKVTNLQYKFPANFFNVGDRIRIYASISKAGGTTTGAALVRMGTAGTTADAAVIPSWVIMATTGRSAGMFVDFTIANVGVGTAATQQEGAPPAAQNAGSYPNSGTIAFPAAAAIADVSNQLFVEVDITPGATDAVTLQNGRMEYLSA